MTTAQVVEISVTVNNHSPIQDYVHPDDQTQPTFYIVLLNILIFFIVYWNECNLLSSLDRSLGTMTARISTPLGCSFDKRENI